MQRTSIPRVEYQLISVTVQFDHVLSNINEDHGMDIQQVLAWRGAGGLAMQPTYFYLLTELQHLSHTHTKSMCGVITLLLTTS